MGSSDDRKTSVVWRELSAELTAPPRRVLLDNTRGVAYHERILAIIGPSGAGKTTLLQALAGRLERTSKVAVTGSITPARSRPAAFVYQDDAFQSRLTVEETLRFAGALRLPASELGERVTSALATMGLQELAASIIGNAKTRGISGGEKKRLAIGCALLAEDPHAPLYADEPTSGLDSYQARRIAEVLRNSARGGRAVLLSIHQPSARLLECFDDVLLLSGTGATLFCGDTHELVPALAKLSGLACPPTFSPAEWALDLASIDPADVAGTRERLTHYAALWRTAETAARANTLTDHALVAARSSWAVQLTWCLWRSWKQSTSLSLLVFRLIGTVMPGICFGCIWWALPPTVASLRARVGLLQVLCNFAGVTAAMKAVRVLQDGEALSVRRERAAGALRLPAYFLGKLLAELPVNIGLAFLLAGLSHTMAGLMGSVAELALLLGLQTLAAGALGLLAGAAAPTLDAGLEVTKSLTTLSTVFGGMYFDATTLPWALQWMPRTSMVRVTCDGMMRSETAALEAAGVVKSAAAILADNGVAPASPTAAALDLLVIAGVLFVAAYLALAVKAPRFAAISLMPPQKGKQD